MEIDRDRCKGCGLCREVCPLGLVALEEGKARIQEGCVSCRTCERVCPEGAIFGGRPSDHPQCTACPVLCRIPPGGLGACGRYRNEDGTVTRKVRIHTLEEVEALVGQGEETGPGRPLILGIGVGTTYPDFRPSPFIVRGVCDGEDCVTVVTEAPLSYTGLKVKVDTDAPVGEEGKKVWVRLRGKRHVGHLCTEEYGSRILSLGGATVLTSRDGIFAARCLHGLLSGREVRLQVEGGSLLDLTLGKAPKVDGVCGERMRVGCGSATTGLFAPAMADAADEVIVFDGHITALFTEHPSGRYLGVPPSGIRLKGEKSTEGRYFLGKGKGWGGTSVEDPLDALVPPEGGTVREGMCLLCTDTTGTRAACYRFLGGKWHPSPFPETAGAFLDLLRASCEPAGVSAVLAAGIGGSARAGVTKHPVRLTRAVHEGRVRVTLGGARPFLLPGGGITLLVDVARILRGAIYLTPTPSFVVPIEYTMSYETFEAIGGHMEAIRPLEEVLGT